MKLFELIQKEVVDTTRRGFLKGLGAVAQSAATSNAAKVAGQTQKDQEIEKDDQPQLTSKISEELQAVDELRGVKSHPAYQAARNINPEPFDEYDPETPISRIEKFIKGLEQQGFKPTVMGKGHFATVFEHPTKKDRVIKLFTDDPNYYRYAKFAQINWRKNYHIPRVYSIGKIDDRTFYVNIEKLQPLKNQRLAKLLADINLNKNANNVKAMAKQMDPDLYEKYPGFFQVIKVVADNFQDIYWDLHKHNIMQRPSGIPVIVDPIID